MLKFREIYVSIVYFFLNFVTILREISLKFLGVGLLVPKGSNIYDVNYYFDGKIWTLRLKDTGDRLIFLDVLNEKEKNITEEIKRLIGPFKQLPPSTTPKKLGYETLTFKVLKFGKLESLVFDSCDIIIF